MTKLLWVLLLVLGVVVASLLNPAATPWCICAGAVAALVWVVTRRTVWAIQSRNWPSVTASELSVQLIDDSNDSSPPVLRVRYSYVVDRRQYQGTRIRLPFGVVRSVGRIYRKEKSLLSGKADVYFDPGNPGTSTLEPGLSVLDGIAVLVFYSAATALLAFLIGLAINARQA